MNERADVEREALEHSPCGIVAFSDDGLIAYANPSLHAWLGKPARALLGTRFESALAPGARVFHSTHFFPLLKLHGHAEEIHLTLRTGAGVDVPVLVNAVRQSGPEGALNHCAMITMHRRKEFESALVDARRAAETATAAKDQFLAIVSHELRTPLSAITGWIRLARSGKLDPEMMTRALETIDRNAEVQAQLIEDLLDVSRIISGKLRISPKPLNLAPLVENALDTARPSASAKGVTLQAALDPAAGIVHADAARVQQIVWNLLANAVKFTPRGGRVQVVLSRVGSRVQINVADSGIGIAGDQLPYLFERFWQAQAGGQREASGLGLGLSICRSLVELHGGSIRAESAGAGCGAAFIVELPLALADTSVAAGVAPDVDAHRSLGGVRVLVVDDDADARSLLTMLLEGSDATVRTAASVDEALDRMRAEPFAIVLTDVGMPGKDGFAFMRELRSNPELANGAAIIVAITGLSRSEDRVRLLRAGFQAHLAKPVDPAELVALVSAFSRRNGR